SPMPERRHNLPTIHHGDCIQVMNAMPANSIDAIVTDPPYGLGFMGRKWDGLPPSLEWAEACMRVLKPGGHIVAFGGTRTWHRLAVAIEDAGFEMRDSLAWLYGSGFPKSHDVGKAIDKLAGAEREVVGQSPYAARRPNPMGGSVYEMNAAGYDVSAGLTVTAPATPEAKQWDGWGTALKPAFEPIVLARKPLAEKTVARNVLAHGTGAINVDACRIGTTVETWPKSRMYGGKSAVSFTNSDETISAQPTGSAPSGRWPANVLLDHHTAAWVDEQSGVLKSGGGDRGTTSRDGLMGPDSDRGRRTLYSREADEGGASRFFYTAKAAKRERPNVNGVQHPTVKPLAIMRWLIRLVTPPGGTVLDPFAGSGTTIEAAIIEGFDPVGIEMEADYLPLIQHRIDRQAGTLTA